LGYAAGHINYAEKSFMKFTTGVNFIKLFQHNLHLQWRNPSQNLRQYADRSINYDEKSFMKLATGVHFIKLFGA
jgi:hypothetical protein